MTRHALVISLTLVLGAPALAVDTTPEERAAAVAEISGLNKEGKLDKIRALLRAKNVKKRYLAAWGVADLKLKELTAEMAALLRDSSDSVRCEGASYLCMTNPEGYGPQMTEALSDKSKCVRLEAVHYLGRRGSEEQKQAAAARQNDPELSVRKAVAEYIPMTSLTKEETDLASAEAKAARSSGKFDALKAKLKSGKRRVRQATTYGVGDAGITELATSMASLLDDPEPLVRFEAAWYFAEHKIPGYEGALKLALKDPSPHVRKEAEQYLAAMSPKPPTQTPRVLALPSNAWCDQKLEELFYLERLTPIVTGGTVVPGKDIGAGHNYVLALPDGSIFGLWAPRKMLEDYVGRQVRVSGCNQDSVIAVFDLASP